MQTTLLNLSADIINVRDIIARVEELEAEQSADPMAFDNGEELDGLTELLSELQRVGGDWYPLTLTR